MPKTLCGVRALIAIVALGLAACSSSHLLPPETQGPPAMVDDGCARRL